MDPAQPVHVPEPPADRCGSGGLPGPDTAAARNPFVDSLLWIVVLLPGLIEDWLEELWLTITYR